MFHLIVAQAGIRYLFPRFIRVYIKINCVKIS